MIRLFRPHLDHGDLDSVAPERLLLLAIFGNNKSRRRVRAELDRRAHQRSPHRPAARRSRQLQPAA